MHSIRKVLFQLPRAVITIAILCPLILLTLVDQFGYAERAQSADVIVLLGSMVNPNGQIGVALERRAEHAAALYRRGLAAHIICSGAVNNDNPPAEAVVGCNRVAELGGERPYLFSAQVGRA